MFVSEVFGRQILLCVGVRQILPTPTQCFGVDLANTNSCFWVNLLCWYSLLSEVLDHQVAAYVKGDFLSNFLYILIIFKRQIPKDNLNKLNLCW